MTRVLLIGVVLGAALCALPAQSFVNYEAPLCHPVRVSADGARLFTVNTVDDRLTVWSLANPSAPVILAEIPVGQRPVSVTPRTTDEIWVVNWLSDSVSIVSLSAGRVVETLRAPDEPADVAFANGRAFVTSAASDLVRVFDVSSRTEVGAVSVFGRDPRALVGSGNTIYALVQRSGNGTTVLPSGDAPPPPAPTNPALPPAPDQALIVRADDPQWTNTLGYSVPDYDIAEIDANTLTVTRYIAAIGTNNFDLVVDGAGQRLWVSNTEARNLVRFEPNLRGHCIDSRITRVTLNPNPIVAAFDLNPGINYAMLPNPAAAATALAEPTAIVLDEVAGELFVAAHGTDRIGVTDLSGNVVARIDVALGNNNTREKRGPRGLARHPSASRLYVYNRLSKTLSVIDTQGRVVVGEHPVASFDPEPPDISEGRRFLYDAKLSGNGTMSCASCHVDGDLDGIAWDLGDPGGILAAVPGGQPFPFNIGLGSFHPMKGPMTTQTLRGLENVGPLHWRGDRADFQAFNPAFDGLMGGAPIPTVDMNSYAAFGTSVAFPPNPNQNLDRSLETTPNNANQQAGFNAFTSQSVSFAGGMVQGTCSTCHGLPTGTSGFVVSGMFMNIPQDMKVPQLRNVYRKLGFTQQNGQASKLGFGLINDGSIDTIQHFLQSSQFNAWPNNIKNDLERFIEVFDTGTAPLVGYQVTVDASSFSTPSVVAELNLMRTRAAAGDIDLVSRGRLAGQDAAWLYSPASQLFLPDRASLPSLSLAAMQSTIVSGDTLTFTGATPGGGDRIAHDRDGDGVLDGDEAPDVYGPETPGGWGPVTIGANSEARIGNEALAVVLGGAPPSGSGVLAFAANPTNVPLGGITLLVDLFDPGAPGVWVAIVADPRGAFALAAPLPQDPALIGTGIRMQAAWVDPGAAAGISASPGLHVTIRP